MGRLSENSVLNIKNKSFSVTAELEVPPRGAEGVIIAQGGRFGGWSSMPRAARPSSSTTCSASKSASPRPAEPIPAGKTQVRMEFAYDGGGIGKGGTVTLYYDGKEVGKGRVEQTQAIRLLRGRDHGHRLRVRHDRQPRLHGRTPAGSTARSTGCRSTSARTPRTQMTSSSAEERLRVAMVRRWEEHRTDEGDALRLPSPNEVIGSRRNGDIRVLVYSRAGEQKTGRGKRP